MADVGHHQLLHAIIIIISDLDPLALLWRKKARARDRHRLVCQRMEDKKNQHHKADGDVGIPSDYRSTATQAQQWACQGLGRKVATPDC